MSNVHTWIQEYYGKVLSASQDLKTNACCVSGPPPRRIANALAQVHEDVLSRFYGCGFPIPEVVKGAAVLDLGCGSGRDVYVLAQLVGPEGRVLGVDMTEEQLAIAEATQSWHADRWGYERPNTEFRKGYIEDLQALGVESGSQDLVVSNCVVNLSPRKDLVLSEVHRVLREGGEFYFSDVVVDRRLPPEIAQDPVLYGECLGGALYRHDFEDLARATGFGDPRVLSVAPITIQNDEVEQKVRGARFYSVTYRLFKLEGLEPRCEDYGQIATYRGGIEGAETVFWLDDHHAFEASRPERVCGNTARMLAETRFAPFVEVVGDRTRHFGLFPCGPTMAAQEYGAPDGLESSGCC